jgi:hypothetical protein
MSRREYAQFKRMLGCQKCPREFPLSRPTSIYRHRQHKIVVRHLTLLLSGWSDAQVNIDLTRPASGHATASLLNCWHVALFKSRSLDRQRSLNRSERVGEWLDASIKLIGRTPGVRSPRACAAKQLTGRASTTHLTPRDQRSVDNRKLLERYFYDRTRPNSGDRTHPASG